MPGGDGTMSQYRCVSYRDLGSGARRKKLAGKGVPGFPGSDFRGKAPAGEQAQPRLWRASEEE